MVTTLPLFADFVRQIGGDRVEVTSLVPTGADPHTWEPAPSDVQRVAEADIAFANGLDLEPAAIKVVDANLKNGADFVRLGDEVVSLLSGIWFGYVEPHIWMDPERALLYVEVIRQRLTLADEQSASVYEANYMKYEGELREAIVATRDMIHSVKPADRKLITTHDAFGHLADAYGFETVAVVAEGPGQEPSPEDVANLARAIEREGVPAVFIEPQISAESEILQQAAEDADVQVCTLYSDSLDDKVTSYLELMRFNADELARCLGVDGGG